MKLRHFWFALVGMATLPGWAADDTLVVTLAGVQHAKGQMRVSLYADPKTFRKEDKAQAIQTEGYGLSNNPTVMGPPKFEDSAFDVPAPDGRVRIDIVY